MVFFERFLSNFKKFSNSSKQTFHFIINNYNGGPVGIDTIAAGLYEEKDTIEDVFEPYLIMKGLVQRTRQGRILTQLGKQRLGIRTSNGPLFELIEDSTSSAHE